MYTENWQVEGLEVQPSLLGYTNLVVAVTWKYTVQSSLGFHATSGVTTLIPPRDTDTYRDYNTLTESQVISWVHDSMGQEQINRLRQRTFSMLENSSQSLGSRNSLTSGFPWSQGV